MFDLLLALAVLVTQGGTNATWGGDHVRLELTDNGGRVEFDCAHGTIDGPVTPDAKGAFRAKGTFTPERGGPIREDAPPAKLKATYSGTITGDTMTLKVVVQGEESDPSEFTLTRGDEGHLTKCR